MRRLVAALRFWDLGDGRCALFECIHVRRIAPRFILRIRNSQSGDKSPHSNGQAQRAERAFGEQCDISAIFERGTPRLALRQFLFIFMGAKFMICLGALKCWRGWEFGRAVGDFYLLS